MNVTLQIKFFFFLIILSTSLIHPKPQPVQFSISETKVVKSVPNKTRDFAYIVPGKLETYIYDNEEDYYKGYQESYFAVTCKKAGWDCLRHYEILANGCIPYFIDIDQCPEKTLAYFPKDLVREAMQLEGVSYLHIDHSKFNKKRYYEILEQLLEYTRNYLTSRKMAEHVLNCVNYSGQGKVLFLSRDQYPDYLRCTMLIGFKELLGDRLVDFPKIEHIYVNFKADIRTIYGKGITYTKIVEDIPLDRENIEQRIANHEFELIVYGSVHRGLLFHDLVRAFYPKEKIVYLCGEDAHFCTFAHLDNLFLREHDYNY